MARVAVRSPAPSSAHALAALAALACFAALPLLLLAQCAPSSACPRAMLLTSGAPLVSQAQAEPRREPQASAAGAAHPRPWLSHAEQSSAERGSTRGQLAAECDVPHGARRAAPRGECGACSRHARYISYILMSQSCHRRLMTWSRPRQSADQGTREGLTHGPRIEPASRLAAAAWRAGWD